MKNKILKFASFIFLLVSFNSVVSAKPIIIVGEPQEETVSISAISHSSFDTLLKKYVNDLGDVDYEAWKASDADTLKTYLETFAKADREIDSIDEHRLAFWINAYNALTIHGILDKYPTTSIRNHTAKIFGYNIWHDLRLTVGDKNYSLDQIEHQILRHMNEPRIHFAIVCASHSCPKLLNEAFDAHHLDAQLSKNAIDFFANSENFGVNGNRVQLSSLLDWFKEDFGNNTQDVLDSISPYLPEDGSDAIEDLDGNYKVSYLPYSWELNDIKTAEKRRK